MTRSVARSLCDSWVFRNIVKQALRDNEIAQFGPVQLVLNDSLENKSQRCHSDTTHTRLSVYACHEAPLSPFFQRSRLAPSNKDQWKRVGASGNTRDYPLAAMQSAKRQLTSERPAHLLSSTAEIIAPTKRNAREINATFLASCRGQIQLPPKPSSDGWWWHT